MSQLTAPTSQAGKILDPNYVVARDAVALMPLLSHHLGKACGRVDVHHGPWPEKPDWQRGIRIGRYTTVPFLTASS
jgi:hypothetical protein